MTAIILPFPNPEPWKHEPDQVSYYFGSYHLFIKRHPHLLCLNGYVGITDKHPYYGATFHDKRLSEINVHWGVTYADSGDYQSGMQKGLWYIGFDTGHFGDYVPGLIRDITEMYKKMGVPMVIPEIGGGIEDYKDIHFVKRETEQLYTQLLEIHKEHRLKKYQKRMKRRSEGNGG